MINFISIFRFMFIEFHTIVLTYQLEGLNLITSEQKPIFLNATLCVVLLCFIIANLFIY